MITHVVFFKLKDRSPEIIEKTRQVLANMEGNVPQLLHIEVGTDILHQARSYDIALITKFASLDDLHDYDTHPFHEEVKVYMKSVVDVSASVDFES